MTLTFVNKSELSGSVTALSTYQDIINISRSINYPVFVEGWMDLTNMAASDTINIQERIWINDSYSEFEEQNISNAQDDAALHFHSKFAPEGIFNLKFNQSFGTLRDYSYHFIILNMTL